MKKEKLFYVLLIFCIYAFIFQNFLQDYILIFKYFDELFAFISIPYIIFWLYFNNGSVRKLTRMDFILVICLVILIFVGLFSNFKYGYQSLKVAFVDVVLILKFFLAYFLSKFLWNTSFLEKKRDNITFHLKAICIILFALTIINYCFDIFGNSTRFGIIANGLFYSHPTYLASACMFLLIMNVLIMKKVNSIFNLMLVVILFSTLRFKAIGAVIAIIIVAFYILKTGKKMSLLKLGAIGILCLIIGFKQISFYFIEIGDSARKQLLVNSFEIANDYFPVGTGFATYSSYYSGVYYSPIYQMYGLEKVHGIKKTNFSFISDNFWPMIIGQFGYLGCIFYCICILMIYLNIQNEFKKGDKYIYVAKISCLLYLIISSVSESAFVNPVAIPLAVIIGFYNNSKVNNQKKYVTNGNEEVMSV